MEQKKLSVEELLRPRYEVVAGYPGSPFKAGRVIADMQLLSTYVENADQYPHPFRRMGWVENREASELPDYIKYDAVEEGKEVHYFFKVEDWTAHAIGIAKGEYFKNGKYHSSGEISITDGDLPATEEEFLTFKNQPK